MNLDRFSQGLPDIQDDFYGYCGICEEAIQEKSLEERGLCSECLGLVEFLENTEEDDNGNQSKDTEG